MSTGKLHYGCRNEKRLSKSVAGSANVTLTAEECKAGLIELTGALTGAITVYCQFEEGDIKYLRNNTTGNYALTFSPLPSGTGIATTANGTQKRLMCYYDGTDLQQMQATY